MKQNKKYKWPYWSDWHNLQEAVKRGNTAIPATPGAYVIAADKKIKRCGKTDRQGILTIGQTGNNLRARARVFYKCASDESDDDPGGYSAGYWFWALSMIDIYPLASLRICWRQFSDGEKARREESRLMTVYTNTYYELPPLNRSYNWRSPHTRARDTF